jgi:hypothetical protein
MDRRLRRHGDARAGERIEVFEWWRQASGAVLNKRKLKVDACCMSGLPGKVGEIFRVDLMLEARFPQNPLLGLLMEVSNPGSWTAHCHIADHLEGGMMLSFQVH